MNVFIFLAILWPFINFIENNFSKLDDYNSLMSILFPCILITYAACYIFKHSMKLGPDHFFVLLFLGVLGFFSFGPFCDFLKDLPLPHPLFKVSYLWLFCLLIVLYSGYRFGSLPAVQAFLKTVCVIMLVIPCAGIIQSSLNRRESSPTIENIPIAENFTFKNQPNVYFLLVDAYGRQDTLAATANFDNSSFLGKLKNLGFIVARNAYSNYHFTGASLSATMNMSLHPSDSQGLVSYETSMHPSLRGYNQVRKIFQNNGYKIVYLPAHWHQMDCNGKEDKCIKRSNLDVVRNFIEPTPLRAFLRFIPPHYVSLKDLEAAIEVFPNKPKFVFAHLAQVHDAIYGPSCRFETIRHPLYDSSITAQPYVQSVKCLNKSLINFIELTRKKDPHAIIIIQADHGPTFTGNKINKDVSYWLKNTDAWDIKSADDLRNSFGILSAIYIPDLSLEHSIGRYLSEKPSPVNLFRVIFAFLSEKKPILEEDRSILLNFDSKINAYHSRDVSSYKKASIN